MKIRKQRESIFAQYEICGIFCDKCKNQIIAPSDKDWQQYFTMTAGHSDWGNDSIDSVFHRDYCSYACLQDGIEWMNEDYKSNYLSVEKVWTKYTEPLFLTILPKGYVVEYE